MAAGAGDWKWSSGLALSERYSDNVLLRNTGQQDEWITEISPRLGVQRQGARLKVNADYSLQGLLYANGTQSNKLRHSLNGRANAELVEDWFFLDTTARVSHELKSLAGGVGLGDPVGLDNTTTVGAYTLSPYMKHRFGHVASVEARLSQSGVFISDANYTDSNVTRYTLNANSGTFFFPLSWGLQYDRTENNNATVADTRSETASANARYQLDRHYGLTAQAGMEKHSFTGVNNRLRDYAYYGLGMYYTSGRRLSVDALYNHSDNGDFLSGSVTAQPTLRTTIKATASQRAFGRSYALDLTHRTRHSTWGLTYKDDLTTYQQQFLAYQGSLYYYDCPTGPEPYQTGIPPSDPGACVLRQIKVFSPTQSNETFVSKSLLGRVTYTLRHNTWSLNLYNNQRDFQNSGTRDITRGLQASWGYKPLPRTTYTLTGGLSRSEESGTGRNDDLWHLGLVISHQFQAKLMGSLEVRHQERQSNQANGDYAENSVAARLNMSF
jgi:uncharacterized protein (PEP-CTERM system associated)